MLKYDKNSNLDMLHQDDWAVLFVVSATAFS